MKVLMYYLPNFKNEQLRKQHWDANLCREKHGEHAESLHLVPK